MRWLSVRLEEGAGWLVLTLLKVPPAPEDEPSVRVGFCPSLPMFWGRGIHKWGWINILGRACPCSFPLA